MILKQNVTAWSGEQNQCCGSQFTCKIKTMLIIFLYEWVMIHIEFVPDRNNREPWILFTSTENPMEVDFESEATVLWGRH